MNARTIWQCLKNSTFVAAIVFCGGELAYAQVGQGGNQFGSNFRNRPTVSPYLSMVDNGSGNGALNYFNIVRPRQRAETRARDFQRELHTVESGLQNSNGAPAPITNATPITTGRLPTTGHTTAFGDVGTYFGGGSGASANQFGRNGKRR